METLLCAVILQGRLPDRALEVCFGGRGPTLGMGRCSWFLGVVWEREWLQAKALHSGTSGGDGLEYHVPLEGVAVLHLPASGLQVKTLDHSLVSAAAEAHCVVSCHPLEGAVVEPRSVQLRHVFIGAQIWIIARSSFGPGARQSRLPPSVLHGSSLAPLSRCSQQARCSMIWSGRARGPSR